ncbi:MAG TPA: hypothetical protein DCR65_09580 [Gammaproteobacteria bacterium]|jgi:uncharacterized protein YaiL (DUF2058 family)|nr:hypothetical protein [Gammaproteobacteria bacterium]
MFACATGWAHIAIGANSAPDFVLALRPASAPFIRRSMGSFGAPIIEVAMSQSLRDQLIKAGLADASKARKAERQQRAEQRTAQSTTKKQAANQVDADANTRTAKPVQTGTASANARAQAALREKAERDRAKQRELNAKAAEKALRAELKQLIQSNDQREKVAREDDVPYNFVHGRRVKRIYITRAQQSALSAGTLVIVNDDGRYHIIDQETAERVKARDPKRIIAAHTDARAESGAAEPGSDAEYYARFAVPDDLDW